MSHVTGVILVDAPASALNNAGQDTEAQTDNAVAVKVVRAPDGRYPYVSAQAVRFWLRTALASDAAWTASPVFRESKVAYTDAEPTKYAEDDLFGYMRAQSRSSDEKKAAKRAEIAAISTPVDAETGEVTRVSPFRVGTLIATAPVRVTSDFGTMARAEGDPVPHEHQFYRGHLRAPFGVDLTCAGTFFTSKRVGYKNLDKNRQESAKAAGATAVKLRGFEALRLPFDTRSARVAKLVRAIGRLEGGAKQTLHLTDTNPAVLLLAVCKHGNQPFLRVLSAGDNGRTVLRDDVLEEALRVFGKDLQTPLYVGWAIGFLDEERKKLVAFAADEKRCHGVKIVVGHPIEIADRVATALTSKDATAWFE